MGRTKRQHYIVRLFALALCLLLVAAALPGRAYALSGTTGGLNWSLSAGTLRISGSGPMPEYTDGSMAPWYDSAGAVSRIVVDEGVTSVGSLAFYGCSAAAWVTLPSTVKAIGDRAFKNCSDLTWLNLPEGLETIGEAAFEGCAALNGIFLPESLRTLENFAFDGCTGLTSIVIPAGVTDLGKVVFYNCTGLTWVEICCPIEVLPDWFFYGCTALNMVQLPETVTQTGEQAFHECKNLSAVFYSGTASEKLTDTLVSDETTRHAAVSDGSTSAIPPTASSTTLDAAQSTSTTVTVTRTEQAVITETAKTDYTCVLEGEVISMEQAMASSEPEKVDITSQTNTVITATVSGSDGWKEVTSAAKDAAVHRSDNSSVDVRVQLTDSAVSGSDLSDLAGADTRLTVSTAEGCVWTIETESQRRGSFGREEIDLNYTVELVESEVKGIASDTVYQVEFASGVGFEAAVGVPVKVADAQQYATMYQVDALTVTEMSSVVVDESGYAWFPVSAVDPKTDYYVAIDAEGADKENAIVPDSMLENYGADYVETLTDGSGKQYQVGQRESRWGITGKQFTIYVAIGLGVLVLVTSGVMITLNKINRSKAKYAAMAAADADNYEIDEETLRLQIMQELLEEVRQKNSGE